MIRTRRFAEKVKPTIPYVRVGAQEWVIFQRSKLLNKWFLWATGLIVLLTFGIKIVWFDYSIDTEVAIDNYQGILHSWVTINRFGVVLMKKLLFPHMFNPYLANTLTYATLFLVAAGLSLLFYRLASRVFKALPAYLFVLFAALFVTSPILAEMFNFISLSFEICFGMLCVVGALYMAFLYVEYGGVATIVMSLLLSSFAFSVYQALPAFYIAGAAACLVLYCGAGDSKFHLRKYWKYAITLGISFVISMLIYYSLPHVYHLLRGGSMVGSDYLSKQIVWGTIPTRDVLHNIKTAVSDVVLGHGYFYNDALLVGVVLLVISLIANFRRREIARQVSLIVTLGALLVSPFLLLLILGSAGVLRNNMPALQLVTAFLYFYVFLTLRPKWAKSIVAILALGFAFVQLVATSNILFLEHMKYEEDVALTTRIASRLDELGFSDYQNYKLVVVGSHSTQIPHSVRYNLAGEAPFNLALDKSFYEWDTTSPVGVSDRAAGFMASQGYRFVLLNPSDPHDLSLFHHWATQAQILPEWPATGSVVVDSADKVVALRF